MGFRSALRGLPQGIFIVLLYLAGLCVFQPPPGMTEVREPNAPDAEEFLTAHGNIGRPGGSILFAERSGPKTLNPLISMDVPSRDIIALMMADLIHINRDSQETEPALAKSWAVSADLRRYTLHLRRGVRFSDGWPLTADDVVFTWRAYLDEKVHSPQRDLLIVSGKPIAVQKVDNFTVTFTLPQPYAAVERIFDSVWILPRHLLEPPLERGEAGSAWGLSTPPGEIAGLGPFRLRQYIPGQRIVLERNPYYWKRDSKGQTLPYLNAIVAELVANSDAEALRFAAGETDIVSRLNPADFETLKSQEERRHFRLRDLGPGLEYGFLFFNENVFHDNPPFPAERQSWFRRAEFRRAISNAIDRAAIVKLAYRGRAYPLSVQVTPGNRFWGNRNIPQPVRSLDLARKLLRSCGFNWNSQGSLLDEHGHPVAFSLLVNAGNTQQVQLGTLIQQDLKDIGIDMTLNPLEFHTFLDRIFSSHKYEAAMMVLAGFDTDPNADLNFLTSQGNAHVWSLDTGASIPSWQREIDSLMQRQLTEPGREGRKQIYDRVQELIWENMPVICLIAPHILVGAKNRVGNFQPAIFGNYTMWNAEELFIR
jgi:peptide/nickel transport system substrate-binding protein